MRRAHWAVGGAAGLALAVGVYLGLGSLGSETAAPPAFDKYRATDARPAPSFAFTDAAGKPASLADFRGRVVVLNFWATWCAPCVREMPALQRLAREVSPGAEVILLSQDRGGLPVVRAFYDKQGLDLPIYLDPRNEAARAFGLVGLPTTIVIDAEGLERGRLEGAAEWDSDAAKRLVRWYQQPGPARRP